MANTDETEHPSLPDISHSALSVLITSGCLPVNIQFISTLSKALTHLVLHKHLR